MAIVETAERISTGKAARICGLTKPTLLRLAKAGKVPGAVELTPKLWRFDVKRLTQWVEQTKKRGVPLKYARDPEYTIEASELYDIRKAAVSLGHDFGLGNEFIYFIRASNGNIKVGKSNNPTKRLCALQGACPLKLELLGTIPGNLDIERLIHLNFARHRTRGEWYRPTRRLLLFIEQALREHG